MVPFDREVTRVGLAEFFATQSVGVRLNGTLPFGLVRRCAALLDVGGHHREGRALRERADVVRTALDAGMADATALLVARADAAALALDAAASARATSSAVALSLIHIPEPPRPY